MPLANSLSNLPLWIYIYGLPLFIILGVYLAIKIRRSKSSSRIHTDALKSGMIEPASLHPLIDPNLCLACGSCVKACPEKNVLGLIRGKAQLIAPSHCIGHGACRTACPFDAITLVFGTERRGMDIPNVHPNFETNVAGVFIAGELGGMGLIRNAVRQGAQALESISKLDGIGKGDQFDVVIIGAGPAGISASLGAMHRKLRFVTLEQDTFGGTVSHYPRGKVVMTAPVDLPMIGKMPFKETTKENLMEFWEGIRKNTGLKINTSERVDEVNIIDNGFVVTTPKNTYKTRAILLSIGRRGTPRKLAVPGEDATKVVYRLIDPEQYRGQRVLVVGGGDSALEAATSIADEADTTVSLSYRSGAFNRAKQKNREKVEAAVQAGRLTLYMASNVKEITDKTVILDQEGERIEIENDAVIVSAGGILPTPFLKSIGIEVETKFGTS